MIVVADTSPVNYLVLIDCITVLPRLYGRVLVPYAVWRELQHADTPEKVRQWITTAPEWLEIRVPKFSPKNVLQNLTSGAAGS